MKLLVDAVCSNHGGIATYVENLVASWVTLYPDDDLTVLVSPDHQMTLPRDGVDVREIRIGQPLRPRRPLAQTRAIRDAVGRDRPDALLATLLSTTLRHADVPTLAVVHDLRHEIRPDQFGRVHRLQRRLSYGRGYAVADGFIALSRRTLDDLHRLHPATARRYGVVVHLAADHVDRWPTPTQSGPAIAFAHHPNKNIDLVLDAWARYAEQTGDEPPHVVVGVDDARRDELRSRVIRDGTASRIEVLPYLATAEFQRIMASASLVVYPSNFEGFGLPVIEAMRLRIPVVVGPDPAVLEIAAGHATVMTQWTAQALVAAVVRARASDAADLEPAAAHAARFRWTATATATRDALLTIMGEGSAQPAAGLPPGRP